MNKHGLSRTRLWQLYREAKDALRMTAANDNGSIADRDGGGR